MQTGFPPPSHTPSNTHTTYTHSHTITTHTTYTHSHTITTHIHTCRDFPALRMSLFCSPFCCLERTVERRVVILLRMAAACRGMVAVCSSSLESSTLSPPIPWKERASPANRGLDHPGAKPSLVVTLGMRTTTTPCLRQRCTGNHGNEDHNDPVPKAAVHR